MSKLVYKTKQPKKGFSHFESLSTHKLEGLRDKLPKQETQSQANRLVSDHLRILLIELDKIGYDCAKCHFTIHTK